MTFRSSLYRLGSLLGWINAARRGRLPQRVLRVVAWRTAARLLGRLPR